MAKKQGSFLRAALTARRQYCKQQQAGKTVCAIVSIKDLKLLEALEDQLDIDMARQTLAEAGEERISFQSLIEKLGL